METTMKNGRFGTRLGSMIAIYGAMLASLGGYVGPSWRLCWSILEAMMAHLKVW